MNTIVQMGDPRHVPGQPFDKGASRPGLFPRLPSQQYRRVASNHSAISTIPFVIPASILLFTRHTWIGTRTRQPSSFFNRLEEENDCLVHAMKVLNNILGIVLVKCHEENQWGSILLTAPNEGITSRCLKKLPVLSPVCRGVDTPVSLGVTLRFRRCGVLAIIVLVMCSWSPKFQMVRTMYRCEDDDHLCVRDLFISLTQITGFLYSNLQSKPGSWETVLVW